MKYSVSFAIGVSLTLLGFGYYCGTLDTALIAASVGLSVIAVAAALIYSFLWEHIAFTVLTWLCGVGVMFFGIERLSEYNQIEAVSLMPFLLLLIMVFHSLTYPTLGQNETSGIRTHYTLTYKEVWARTHIFYAVINTASLPPTLFAVLHGGYVFKVALSIATLMAPLFIAAYYSHIIGVKYEKQAEKDILEERKREIEKGWRGPNLKEK